MDLLPTPREKIKDSPSRLPSYIGCNGSAPTPFSGGSCEGGVFILSRGLLKITYVLGMCVNGSLEGVVLLGYGLLSIAEA